MDIFILFLSLYTSVLTGIMMWLLGNKKRAGWAVSMGNQINWVVLAVVTHAYGLLPLTALMTFLAIKGWRNWGESPALANGTREDKLAHIGAIIYVAHQTGYGYFGLLREIEEVLNGKLES